MFSKKTLQNLANNNRFYVLVFSILLSILLMCWLRITTPDDRLYSIQLEQAFGFLAVAALYMTLAMSPIQKLIGRPEWMKNIIFSRRATGVSVVYFGVWHVLVGLYGQLGGWEGLTRLPERYAWSLILAGLAFLIFCVLAATSIDKAIIWMGYPRWKRLQRLVYIAGLLVIVHIWMVGAHFSSPPVQIIGADALAILFGLESWRMGSFLVEHYQLKRAKKYLLFVGILMVWIVFLGLVSYTRPASAHTMSKDAMGGSGAILHIDPDDDPIAGEPSRLVFDVQGLQAGKNTTAKLMITDEQRLESEVPAKINGTLVEVPYIFPRQGVYMLMLTIYESGKQTHSFMQDQRVSRGIIGSVSTTRAPLWAEMGAVGAGVGIVALLLIAFARRKAIATYSKL